MSVFDAYTDVAAPEKECVLNINAHSAEEPRPLFNGRQAAYELKSERPEHRAVIMLKAAALTNKEIAATLGVTPAYVAYVVKQPWAQEQILQEIENAGREPVVQLLQTAAFDAAQRLINIAEVAENLETKRKANNDILDRVLGKPNQPVTTTNVADPSKLSEKEIDDRLAQLYAKRAS